MTQNIASVPASKDKSFQGEYPARVEDVNDPTGQMLVRVRVYGVFADNVAVDDLPWAEYKLPVGSRANNGFFVPVKSMILCGLIFRIRETQGGQE